MKDLNKYIEEQQIDEGILGSSVSFMLLLRMDPEHFKTGLFSMYDYICDEDDIQLFYKDFPLKERPLWINLYKMYTKKIWSIFDMSNISNDSEGSDTDLGEEGDGMTKVTPELRRDIRRIINGSRNPIDLKPGEINMFMTVTDDKTDIKYLLTINRTKSIFKNMFRAADIKFLEKAFSNLK